MPTLEMRFTAGVGVSFSGACGSRLVWHARKPLPCALRSSANPLSSVTSGAPPVHALFSIPPSSFSLSPR